VIKISFPNGDPVELGSVIHHKDKAWSVEDIEKIGLEVKHYMDEEERQRLTRAKMALREYWEDM
jgi:hypothetical protein